MAGWERTGYGLIQARLNGCGIWRSPGSRNFRSFILDEWTSLDQNGTLFGDTFGLTAPAGKEFLHKSILCTNGIHLWINRTRSQLLMPYNPLTIYCNAL